MPHFLYRWQAGGLALLLVACGGRILPLAPTTSWNPDAAAAPNGGAARLVIHIKIPKRKRRLDDEPAYVSASTKAMTIAFKGPSRVKETFDLNVSARHLPASCRRIARGFECTESILLKPCPSKAKCYKGSIATFDAVLCRRSGCTIPPRAHELSANQDVRFSIGAGGGILKFTLDGIPASVAVQPSASSALVENSPTSFTVSKCVTKRQVVSVLGVDADGNDIVGAGAPLSKLKSDDHVHFAVKRQARGSNTFELVPPSSLQSATIPNAGTVVALKASVKPLRRSGMSRAVRSQVDVTFDGDVCGVFSEFPIPTASSELAAIAAGPDAALWFTEQSAGQIGRITTTGSVTEFPIPTSSSKPGGIAAGPDNAMWFAECLGNKIGRITTTGTITETAVPTASSKPFGITLGADHALWFTELAGNNIGQIAPPGGPGSVTEKAVPTANSGSVDIAAGADGALWFTEYLGNKIGRITTAGAITNEYPIPTASSLPFVPAAGPDGAIWFSEEAGNKIGRITTTGVITETAIPTSGSNPIGIADGPDGAMWFVECIGNKVARITTAGIITHEYLIPTSGSQPADIVTGPDGALWFTECLANKIGRLQ